MREILSGQLDPASLPLLRVVKAEDGRLFSLDNRHVAGFFVFFCMLLVYLLSINKQIGASIASESVASGGST